MLNPRAAASDQSLEGNK